VAEPKRKQSKQRSRTRQAANVNLEAAKLGECKHCHAPKLGHQVCPACGYYGDKQIVVKKEKKPKSN